MRWPLHVISGGFASTSKLVFNCSRTQVPRLVLVTTIIVIRQEAFTQPLITHRFRDARSDVVVGINHLAFQKPSPKRKPNTRLGPSTTAEVDLRCVSNLFLSHCLIFFTRSTYFSYDWTDISIKILHKSTSTSSPPIPQTNKQKHMGKYIRLDL